MRNKVSSIHFYLLPNRFGNYFEQVHGFLISEQTMYTLKLSVFSKKPRFVYLFYITFNSQGHIATGSLQVEETSAYCTVNHRASASNYQLSNMKHPARDSNRRPQRLEARTLTATPSSPLKETKELSL